MLNGIMRCFVYWEYFNLESVNIYVEDIRYLGWTLVFEYVLLLLKMEVYVGFQLSTFAKT